MISIIVVISIVAVIGIVWVIWSFKKEYDAIEPEDWDSKPARLGNHLGELYKDKITIEERMAPIHQRMEDSRMRHYINSEAYAMYTAWRDAPIQKIGDKEYKMGEMYIINPWKLHYNVYDEATAKYAKADINELITKEYRRLKKDHEKYINLRNRPLGL